MENKELNNFIHNKLITLQQKFVLYRQLSYNPQFRFNGEAFTECINAIQEVINIARDLAKGVNNDD